jgi:hypothetical protein
MLVAVEHENDSRGFEQEVQKLISVRSRLKVGITYTRYRNYENCDEALRLICEETIRPTWDRVLMSLGEEHKDTEYLFLIGHEKEAKELKWYYKSFRASDGYRPQFDPL